MAKRWLTCLFAVAVIALGASNAFAHGEAGDEPFLKDLTTAFYDVKITPSIVHVGEPVTITGTVRVLNTWPYTLDPPSTAYITPVVPGPVFALKDRIVNGEPAPGSFFVERGGVYQFKMIILGREPGHWHVHPGIAIQGTGTLIGPGEWVDVQPAASPFIFPVSLLNGKVIDLDNYQGSLVWWWSFVGFVLGVIWMLYWTLTKRTVTNLAVTTQIGVNEEAADIGMITPRDHMWMNVLAGITVALLIVGWFYSASRYPVRLPQQTAWFAPKPLPADQKLAEVVPESASWNDGTDTLIMKVQAKNISDSPITVKEYIMAMTTFVNGSDDERAAAGPHDFVGQLEVEPNTPIAPGETRELTLKISNPVLSEERLIPTHDPQQYIAGLLRFQNVSGGEQFAETRISVIPTQFRAQYIPGL